MQTRSIDGSGEPVWVIAPSSAGLRLGPDPRKALWPAAMHAAQTGRTHDRTDQCCSNAKKVLANQAPSTHDPKRILSGSSTILVPAITIPWQGWNLKASSCAF